jgi:hypothetical protein
VTHIAQAGPPFVTDDPEPVEHKHWEIYLASQLAHDSSGWSGTSPHVEINYGAIPNLQLHLIAPVAFNAPAAGSRQFGYGDTELGIKYRFLQETARLPMAGVFPLVELPTGDAARGLGAGHPQVFLPLWLQKSSGPWTTYGGGGIGSTPALGTVTGGLWVGWSNASYLRSWPWAQKFFMKRQRQKVATLTPGLMLAQSSISALLIISCFRPVTRFKDQADFKPTSLSRLLLDRVRLALHQISDVEVRPVG